MSIHTVTTAFVSLVVGAAATFFLTANGPSEAPPVRGDAGLGALTSAVARVERGLSRLEHSLVSAPQPLPASPDAASPVFDTQALAREVQRIVRDELRNALEPARVSAALARAGVPHRPVIQGGVVAAADLELTWVSAQVPYSNYRGAVVDFSGPTWVPLVPALKSYELEPSARVVEQMAATSGFSLSSLIDEYLGTAQVEDPLEVLRSRVLEHLVADGQEGDIEPVLGDRAILPRVAAAREGGLEIFDLDPALCPGGEFSPGFQGHPDVRPDGLHFSREGSRHFADWLVPRLRLATAP